MHIRCTHNTKKLTESHFEGHVFVELFREGHGDAENWRTWNFVFRHPCSTTSNLIIGYCDVAIIEVDGLAFATQTREWIGLPDRERFGPHARAVLDLCLPGILGTVAEILAMQDNGVTVAFAIAQFMGIPGTIETSLDLNYEVEDENRWRELLAPFIIV